MKLDSRLQYSAYFGLWMRIGELLNVSKYKADYECTNSYVYKRDSVIEEAMQRVVILILIVIPRDSVLTQEN